VKEQQKKYLEYVLTKLQPHGPITARAMFGGYGIYFDKIIFASIVERELYFRIDEENQKDYESFGSKPFVYEGGKKPVVMPYRILPQAILEDAKQLPHWIKKACQASLRYKNKSKKKIKSAE